MGGMIIIIFVVFLIYYFAFVTPEVKEEKGKKQAVIKDYLAENDVHVDVEYRYENNFYTNNISWEKGVSYRFVIDEENKQIHILDKRGQGEVLEFGEIIGCEILSDSQTVGGVGRAVVGGILAGEAGAVVGAVTAKKHIMSYKILIYRANIQKPTATLVLIKEKTSTTNADYIRAVEFASNINASIKAIIALEQ